MTYDASRTDTVLFGGETIGTKLNDTWLYEFLGLLTTCDRKTIFQGEAIQYQVTITGSTFPITITAIGPTDFLEMDISQSILYELPDVVTLTLTSTENTPSLDYYYQIISEGEAITSSMPLTLTVLPWYKYYIPMLENEYTTGMR